MITIMSEIGDTLFTLGSVIGISVLPALALFVGYYMRSPWRSTAPGRALMYFILSLLGAMILSTAVTFFGADYIFRGVLRFVIFSMISFTAWRLLFVLWKVQKEKPVILVLADPKYPVKD